MKYYRCIECWAWQFHYKEKCPICGEELIAVIK